MLLTDESLLNYKRCRRRTYLEFHGDSTVQEPIKDFVLKLRQENQLQVAAILNERDYHQPSSPKHHYKERAAQTEALMQQGVECIVNGVLHPQFPTEMDTYLQSFLPDVSLDTTGFVFQGTPTLLVKQPGQSRFGDWCYVPVLVKLGRRPKPEYQIVAAFQALLLAMIQGTWSESQIILRRQNTYQVNLTRWIPRLYEVLEECLEILRSHLEPEVFISRQRCSLCQWYNHCYTLAQTQQHLSLVPGVTPARYQALQEAGLHTLEAVACVKPEVLDQAVGEEVTTRLQRQAQALFYNQPFRTTRTLSVPSAPIELYFDIEAEPEKKVDYLLGVLLVNHQTGTEHFYSFLAEQPEEEAIVWQQFLEFVSKYPDAPIFHYSEYEVDTIKRLAKLYQTPRAEVKEIIGRLVDVHRCVTTLVTLPVENYSLKTLANWLGFTWRDAEASGDQSVCWYDSWLKERDRAFLEAILRYNEDDCRATYRLKRWLTDFLADSTTTPSGF
jgi:predicted RecB family nuclease